MTFKEPLVKLIETNAIKKPRKAQFIVKNPLRAKMFVIAIQLTFDAYFSVKGVIMIKINDNIILAPKTAGSYGNLTSFPITLKDEELPDQKKVEIFVWNGIDSDVVTVSINIQLSEDPLTPVTPDTSLSILRKNQELSEPESLFPKILRQNTDESTLLNLKGYKKFWAILDADNYISPISLVGGSLIVDGNLDTKHGGFNFSGGDREIGKIDFGDIQVRVPTSKTFIGLGLGVGADYNLQVSDNNVDWTTVDEVRRGTNGSNTQDFTQTGASQPFRYLRMFIDNISGTDSGSSTAVYELYDSNLFGGTANLSFEILDKNSGNFFTAISSAEFGTISQGQSSVSQIGDTGDKLFTLPSTQTDFRARLIVTGAITLGISILKVS